MPWWWYNLRIFFLHFFSILPWKEPPHSVSTVGIIMKLCKSKQVQVTLALCDFDAAILTLFSITKFGTLSSFFFSFFSFFFLVCFSYSYSSFSFFRLSKCRLFNFFTSKRKVHSFTMTRRMFLLYLRLKRGRERERERKFFSQNNKWVELWKKTFSSIVSCIMCLTEFHFFLSFFLFSPFTQFSSILHIQNLLWMTKFASFATSTRGSNCTQFDLVLWYISSSSSDSMHQVAFSMNEMKEIVSVSHSLWFLLFLFMWMFPYLDLSFLELILL